VPKLHNPNAPLQEYKGNQVMGAHQPSGIAAGLVLIGFTEAGEKVKQTPLQDTDFGSGQKEGHLQPSMFTSKAAS
jgi:hypothetical protein